MKFKNIVNKGFKYLINKDYRFVINGMRFGMYHDMPDDVYLKRLFRYKMGYDLDLDNPKTFNEKLQWLKLYNRKSEYTTMVDKYEVKAYVAERIGEQYIIPTLGVWNHFDEIDFDKLPDQFVLKCTHDSGGLAICHNRKEFDLKKAKKKVEQSLKKNYFYTGREWPYRNVKPRIIAEQYMEDDTIRELRNYTKTMCAPKSADGPVDYKFYCFGGEPKFFYVGTANIINGEKHDLLSFFDLNWQKTPFYRLDHEQFPYPIRKLKKIDEMLHIARELSKNIPFIRVDLYCIHQQVYFSELTFFPGSGFGKFSPDEWEEKLGSWITLPFDKR